LENEVVQVWKSLENDFKFLYKPCIYGAYKSVTIAIGQ